MANYFIILNAQVVASCKRYAKAMKLFAYYKSKINVDSDLLQVYERGYGIIAEY